MALFLGLAKFTPEGAQSARDMGFQARSETMVQLTADSGGELKGYWYVDDGEWHVAVLMEADWSSAQFADLTFQQMASGAVSASRWMGLVEGADVDSASGIEYGAPGQ